MAGEGTTMLMSRARAGDGDAFRALTEPHRDQLRAHCYRMLGSFQDADDVPQDTLLAAWQGIERTESISLAFVTALQLLPPRQVAVLLLRDVLGFHADEVADMLESTVDSVNSALKRARAGLQRHQATSAVAAGDREPPPAAGSPAEEAIVAKFVPAYESADLDALVALLTDDVFVSMPPMPFEYEGRDAAARFCAGIFSAGLRFDLVPARANGQPAFGAYLNTRPGGIRHGTGLFVLGLRGDRISAMTRFDKSVLPWFGLPRSLPVR